MDRAALFATVPDTGELFAGLELCKNSRGHNDAIAGRGGELYKPPRAVPLTKPIKILRGL